MYPWLLRTYQGAFATVFVSDVRGSLNKILLCKAEDAAFSPTGVRSDAKALATRIDFDFDLAALAATYKNVSSKRLSPKVLTDDYAPVNLMRLRKADEKDWEY